MASDQQALILQVSADVRKLQKDMAKARGIVDTESRGMERRAKAANDNITASFSKGLGKQLQGDLDALGGRAGRVGSVLSAIGPGGLAAAAGIGAVAVAYERAKGALAIGDEIGDAAGKLGIGTEALQEYRYAAQLAGAEMSDADAAISGFTKQVGLAANGAQKSLKVFAALGFTQEQITNFASVEDGLSQVANRIAALDSEADRQAFASKLGLEPLIPLLRQGSEGIEALRQKARDFGLVLSDEVIQKAGEAQEKLEIMSAVIDTQLTVAFAELAPLIADAAGALAELLKHGPELGRFIESFVRIDAAVKRGSAGRWGLGGGLLEGMKEWQAIDAEARRPARSAHDGLFNAPSTPDRPATRLGGGGQALGGGSKSGGSKKSGAVEWRPGFIPADALGLKTVDPSTVFDAAHSLASDAKDPLQLGGAWDDSLDQLVARLDSRKAEIQDSLAYAIEGGLEAGFQDGLPGVLSYFSQQLQRSLIQSLAGGIARSLTKNDSPFGGVGALLTSLIPGFANGTDFAPGGLAVVGERGKELVNLPRGSQVIPNDVLQGLGGARTTVVQPFHFHAEGAVLTGQLLAQANASAARMSADAVKVARSAASGDLARSMRRRLA